MRSSKSQSNHNLDERLPLFPELPMTEPQRVRRFRRIDQLIWSDHKARFIQQYLRYFVQITKHGTYIDGFSGPQYPDRLDAWTASRSLRASQSGCAASIYARSMKRAYTLSAISSQASQFREANPVAGSLAPSRGCFPVTSTAPSIRYWPKVRSRKRRLLSACLTRGHSSAIGRRL